MHSSILLASVAVAWALPASVNLTSHDASPYSLLQPQAADGADVTYAVPECPLRQRDSIVAATTNFIIRDFTYLKYVVAPGQIDALPNTTQVAFALDNSAAAVTTACSFDRGTYDEGKAWYPCGDRTIVESITPEYG